jgi:hypothetical protein
MCSSRNLTQLCAVFGEELHTAYRAALAGSYGYLALDRASCHPSAGLGTQAPIPAPRAPDDRPR